MKYRIVIETERSGKKWYYVQRKVWIIFWEYCVRYNDDVVKFNTKERAEHYIESSIQHEYCNNQRDSEREIVKVEIYKHRVVKV